MGQNVPIPATIGRLSYTCEIFSTVYGNADVQNLATGVLSGLAGEVATGLLGTKRNVFKNNGVRKWLTGGSMAAQMAQVALASTQTKEPLGTATKIEIRQQKDVKRVYSLGDFLYEPSRLVQGKITSSLILSGVATYAGETFERMGFPAWNIYTQQAPFILRVRLFTPQAMAQPLQRVGASAEPIDLFFLDCWVSDNPCTFDAESGQLVRQKLNVDCGRVICSTAQLSSIDSSVSYKLKLF